MAMMNVMALLLNKLATCLATAGLAVAAPQPTDDDKMIKYWSLVSVDC